MDISEYSCFLVWNLSRDSVWLQATGSQLAQVAGGNKPKVNSDTEQSGASVSEGDILIWPCPASPGCPAPGTAQLSAQSGFFTFTTGPASPVSDPATHISSGPECSQLQTPARPILSWSHSYRLCTFAATSSLSLLPSSLLTEAHNLELFSYTQTRSYFFIKIQERNLFINNFLKYFFKPNRKFQQRPQSIPNSQIQMLILNIRLFLHRLVLGHEFILKDEILKHPSFKLIIQVLPR